MRKGGGDESLCEAHYSQKSIQIDVDGAKDCKCNCNPTLTILSLIINLYLVTPSVIRKKSKFKSNISYPF